MAPKLIHHIGQYNKIQSRCDCMNKSQHMGFKYFLL